MDILYTVLSKILIIAILIIFTPNILKYVKTTLKIRILI